MVFRNLKLFFFFIALNAKEEGFVFLVKHNNVEWGLAGGRDDCQIPLCQSYLSGSVSVRSIFSVNLCLNSKSI